MYGNGDLGPQAHAFIDFLKDSGQKVWQVLPLNAVCGRFGFSPYSPVSVFALNHLLISPELMIKSGLIPSLKAEKRFHPRQTDFPTSDRFRYFLAESAYKNQKNILDDPDFNRFAEENADWLADFALFRALKRYFGEGVSWTDWPQNIARREEKSLLKWEIRLEKEIRVEKLLQYIVWRQWLDLKEYANARGIKIMGDLPFYPSLESSDVWSGQRLFRLDGKGKPLFVSGAPPDYFSSSGQLWNTPVYAWPEHEKDDFGWWTARIKKNMELFDYLRLDHFRGFCAYWQVSFGQKTAAGGEWVPGPGRKLMRGLIQIFGRKRFIAEDLGEITADVIKLKEDLKLPGMHVLQFAFGKDIADNPHIPHQHRKNGITYTGTHDNNTVLGWYRRETDSGTRKRIREYTGKRITTRDITSQMLRIAQASVARTAIIPVQDLLGLDETARMNNPGKKKGNWTWRLNPGALNESHSRILAHLCDLYGRK
jgi:4-alpha-glucanotransferase